VFSVRHARNGLSRFGAFGIGVAHSGFGMIVLLRYFSRALIQIGIACCSIG